MKKLFTVLIFSAFISIAAFGQIGKLRGSVYDSKSKKPIAGALVGLYNEDLTVLTAVTDSTGKFYFKSLEPGRYKGKASAIGYNEKRIPEIIIKAGKNSFPDIFLEKRPAK